MGLNFEDLLGGGESTTTAQPKLRVPSNLVPVIEAVERETGVPFEIIAGVIQTNGTTGTSGDWPGGITPDLIVDAALRLQRSVPAGGADAGNWRIAARNAFGGSRATWLDRFDSIVYPKNKDGSYQYDNASWIEREPQQPIGGKTRVPDLGGGVGGGYIYPGGADGPVGPQPVDIGDVYSAFNGLVGRPPTEAEAQRYVGLSGDALRGALLALPEARTFRQYGEQIGQTRRWMDNLWFEFYGRAPTNDEVIGVVNGGYTPDALERKIRAEPIMGTTRGAYADVRTLANKYAREQLGRDADESELNWLMVNLTQKDASGKTLVAPNDRSVSSFYEQVKGRLESGDPNFIWAAAPEAWRAAQQTFQNVWSRSGLLGTVDQTLVNEALRQGWMEQDIQDYVNDLQAPGFQQGIKVGEVIRVRDIANKLKSGYLPGQPLTKEEMTHFVAWTPLQMDDYYRSLPVAMQREARDKMLATRTAEQPVAEQPRAEERPSGGIYGTGGDTLDQLIAKAQAAGKRVIQGEVGKEYTRSDVNEGDLIVYGSGAKREAVVAEHGFQSTTRKGAI